MIRNRITIIALIVFLLSCLLNACTENPISQPPLQDGVPDGNVDVSKIPNAKPKVEAISAYGNPSSYVAAGHRYYVLHNPYGYSKSGIASWYGKKFQNRMTSNREHYDPWAMTAASTELPIPCYVKVTNLENGREVIVKVNDRGPFASNRIIDLSYAAATKLGYSGKGTALVRVNVIDPRNPRMSPTPTVKSVKNPQFYVQVASFDHLPSAQQLQKSLMHLTMRNARIQTIPAGRQKIYRVQIGPLKTVEQSDQLFHQLHQHGYHEAFTVIG